MKDKNIITKRKLIELAKRQQEIIHKQKQMIDLSETTIIKLGKIIDSMAEAVRRYA